MGGHHRSYLRRSYIHIFGHENFIDIAVLLNIRLFMYPPNTKYINTQVQFLLVMTGICKMHKSMKG